MRTSRATRSLGLAAALLLLPGCGSSPDTVTDDAAATAAAAASSSSVAAAGTTTATTPTGDGGVDGGSTAAFPGNTDPDVADAVDPAGLTVTAVRTGRHEGYDRVVFELAGTGTPGWNVEYVDAPAAQGSGAPIDLPGQAFLQVSLQGTAYPYESGAQEVARGQVPVTGAAAVQGVFYDATFEGTSVAYVGTSSRAPFRVYSLTGPSRIVVEVADAG